MGDRTTPLQRSRRARFDVLARVARSPKGARIIWRAKSYVFMRCPGCREWYWRIYSHGHGRHARYGSQQVYCSDACSRERQRVLKKERHRRWWAKTKAARLTSNRRRGAR